MIKLSDYLDTPTMGEVLSGARTKKARRSYAAARVSRLNSGWATEPWTANHILKQDLRTLRARAREMSRNSSHFSKFLQMVRSNVIGPKGIQLQCRARRANGKLNDRLNKRVEEAFWEWGHRETCTTSGKLNWKGVQDLFVTQLARDGEVLLRHVADRSNPFGYSVRLIDVNYLDEMHNEELPGGARILMGIEQDADGRPLAYWLTTPSSDIGISRRARAERVRVPASEITHAFLAVDDELQARGVTWFHAALMDGKSFDGYRTGVITSARMAAMNMGFLVRDASDETEFEGAEDGEGAERQIEIDISPASFNELPQGYSLQQFDPKQPTQNHAEFAKSILRDVACGLGVNYFSLTGDLEAVNYSSARVGLGEERDLWRSLQDFVGEHLCRDVFHHWLRAAMLKGRLVLADGEYRELLNPMWRGRGWRYVDPQKEIGADVLALENSLTTLTDVLAERGIDIREHFETLKAERDLAAQYGIELTFGDQATPASTPITDQTPSAD